MPGDTMDFGALAARLAVNIDDVRACLLMSRDGLTLGVYPAEHESSARDVWDRLLSIGHPERGFLLVGDELWIVARRGPYAGIVIASVTATPGLLLDRLEFTLRAAEELRMQEGASSPGLRTEATRRPRTPLHREPAPETVARGEEPPAWLAAAVPEADVAEAVEAEEESVLSPMLDLSSADGPVDPQAEPTDDPVTPATETSEPEVEAPLDPVRAAMEFASMTGAVGAIPTLRPVEPPARPAPPVDPPATSPDMGADPDVTSESETEMEPELELEDHLEPLEPLEPDDALEAGLQAADPPEGPEPPLEPMGSLDIPLEELPMAPEAEQLEDGEPDHEDPEPEQPEEPEPAAPRSSDDEAEVDPVALAREFAHLFSDSEEEAR